MQRKHVLIVKPSHLLGEGTDIRIAARVFNGIQGMKVTVDYIIALEFYKTEDIRLGLMGVRRVLNKNRFFERVLSQNLMNGSRQRRQPIRSESAVADAFGKRIAEMD